MQLVLRNRHPFNQMKIEKSGSKNYKDEPRRTPAVKENAEEEKNDILILTTNRIVGY